jgi:hypothetical protein
VTIGFSLIQHTLFVFTNLYVPSPDGMSLSMFNPAAWFSAETRLEMWRRRIKRHFQASIEKTSGTPS